MRILIVLIFLASGCTSYRVQQSALVPAATLPPLPASAPAAVDVYLEDSTVTFVSEPERAPDSDAGLWITRHMLQAAATFHPNDYVGIRVLTPVGLQQGAMRAAPTTLQRPDKRVTGGGAGVTLSVPWFGGSQQMHFTGELHLLSIPTRAIATCEFNCTGASPERITHHRRFVEQAVLGVDYVVELRDGVRLALRAATRSHPTNHETISNGTGNAEVSPGPAYAIVGTSLEVQLSEWLSVTPSVQWPVTHSPVVYGPIISVGLRGTIPREPRPAAGRFGYGDSRVSK